MPSDDCDLASLSDTYPTPMKAAKTINHENPLVIAIAIFWANGAFTR